MWSKGRKQETFEFLRKFCSTLARDVGGTDATRSPSVQENRHLLARSYLKQGEWQKDLTMSWTPEVIEEIVNCYQLATEFDPTWSKAWHSWALCNFEAINHLEGYDSEIIDQGDGVLLRHILSAIKGRYLQL
jgi:FKBP12-rapamycin complex-associated protein